MCRETLLFLKTLSFVCGLQKKTIQKPTFLGSFCRLLLYFSAGNRANILFTSCLHTSIALFGTPQTQKIQIFNTAALKVSLFSLRIKDQGPLYRLTMLHWCSAITQKQMPISLLTIASMDQKLLLFALCYYYCSLSTKMKHKLLDRTSSCPYSRGCWSRSGKYGKSLSEVAVDEAGKESVSTLWKKITTLKKKNLSTSLTDLTALQCPWVNCFDTFLWLCMYNISHILY